MLIAVIGSSQIPSSPLAAALEMQGWRTLSLRLESDATAVPPPSEPLAAICVLYDHQEPAWLETVAADRQRTPVLVVSATPPERARPTLWLERLPTTRTLSALLTDWVGRGPPTARRHRKSDVIVGTSPLVQEIHSRLELVSRMTVPVLVSGESGSGKELVARALHFCGPRAERPFVPFNCAAIPDSLFEAELFGHERGAFTGAVRSRPGLIEAAHGGTLFLDEIGELSLALQPKLLRVLETGEVMRLGSTEVRRVDVRLVAATNRCLVDEVAEGRFREDLYYRIGVYPIDVPPLRQRPEDVPALVAHHVAEICHREGVAPVRVTPAALGRLLRYHWPGNVRELVNILHRALLSAGWGTVDADHVILPSDKTPIVSSYRDAKQQFESRYYSQLLRVVGGNVSRAAQLARKTRKEIYDTLRRLRLKVDAFRYEDDA
jgi:transcriptional regulator with GAF, ATPase, and Fis domain